jgi:hypothetical protein
MRHVAPTGGRKTEHIAVAEEAEARICPAQLPRFGGDLVEDRLELESGAADSAQDAADGADRR